MIALLLMMASLATAQRAAPAEPTVVFVCEHGAAKSVIATAYFNKIAAEKGLHARAEYRGVNPQADLSVSALKALRDDGLTVPDRKPSAISQTDFANATVIFAIGCTLPSNATASGKADTWDDVPEDKGYEATRDAIKRHVERLIDDPERVQIHVSENRHQRSNRSSKTLSCAGATLVGHVFTVDAPGGRNER